MSVVTHTSCAVPPRPSPVMATGPRLVNAAGASAITGFPRRSIYRFADAGLMPFGVKVGAARRWSVDELEAWIASGCPPVRSTH